MKTILSDYPKIMNALVLGEYDTSPELKQVKVPRSSKGQVLVKMDSSPVNPSDVMFLRGLYSKKVLPVIPGFEGSGVVVATGDDFFSKRLLGKNVSCFAPHDGNGTWAEYMLASYKQVVPLNKSMDIEQGSMLLVNPLTAVAMVNMAKKGKYSAVANTAAASALGQVLSRMCQDADIPIVNIVRREEQVNLMKKHGAKYVLDSSKTDFKEQMKSLFKELNVRVAFDAISGESATNLLEALPKGGEVIIYGSLSQEALTVDPRSFIFHNKKISGFRLPEWIKHQNILKLFSSFKKIQKFLTETHGIRIDRRVSLREAEKAIEGYMENMTSGKVLIKPGNED